MKILKFFLLLLLTAIIGISVYIAVQPNEFEVTRSRKLNAPASVVYDNVIDFKNWPKWSSWVEEDPNIIIKFSEQTSNVGGSYSWQDKNGAGTMKTLKATPTSSIIQEMQFEDFPPSEVTWNFKSSSDNTTKVIWTIKGEKLPFGFKAYTLFSGGIDKQIGPHYERSLEKLDSIVLASMKVYDITIDGPTYHSGGFYIYNTTSCKISDLSKNIHNKFPEIINYANTHNIHFSGKPFVNYEKWDKENNAVIFSCCVPTTEKVITTADNILTGKLDSFKAVKTTLTGDYINLKEAWDTTFEYISENDITFSENGPMIETYHTSPSDTPNPAKWRTEIYIAIKEVKTTN
ncbi:SRPBCC family protein [Gaetbulibacter saemankumensis]|uniref:SRPBCC family protein n=1 Tax=Gaetbulibacter saemankumensis TaxID=311208 RepID=UPI00041AF10F|nr:SRPBCC family protein [Gaetbulibacter saemankumensis]